MTLNSTLPSVSFIFSILVSFDGCPTTLSPTPVIPLVVTLTSNSVQLPLNPKTLSGEKTFIEDSSLFSVFKSPAGIDDVDPPVPGLEVSLDAAGQLLSVALVHPVPQNPSDEEHETCVREQADPLACPDDELAQIVAIPAPARWLTETVIVLELDPWDEIFPRKRFMLPELFDHPVGSEKFSHEFLAVSFPMFFTVAVMLALPDWEMLVG